ncbi:MAG: co-chaperone GroES [Candidatus Yonathbacteria bacterium]|nr:co-chaperone GroES [Candidatus Yonathbacteria bacterium]
MSTKRKIIPLGDRVLVRALEAVTKTKSGIIIPDTVSKERPEQGVVVEVGSGRTTDTGAIIAPHVKIGDEILFSKYGPDEIKIDDEEYFILSETNILAIIR